MYKCVRCGKQYKFKSDYDRHRRRKTICRKTTVCVQCPNCFKELSCKSSLHRHIKLSCKKQYILEYDESTLNPKQSTIKPKQSTIKPKQSTIKPKQSTIKPKQSTIKSKPIIIDDLDSEYSDDGDFGWECSYCHKEFTMKQNLNRHIKSRCKVKKHITREKEVIYQKLISQLEEIKRDKEDMLNRINQLETEKKHLNVTNNTTNINNISNNISNNINIQLVAFGKEDKYLLNNNEIYQILKKGFLSVPELVKCLHFNENRPENHNIYISNMRDKFVMVYDGDKWGLQDKNETIENIFDDGRDFLIIKHDEFKPKLDDKQIKVLKKFDRFEMLIDTNRCKKKKKKILDEIKLLMYNNKDLIIKSKNLIE
jgi:hypothetical protein